MRQEIPDVRLKNGGRDFADERRNTQSRGRRSDPSSVHSTGLVVGQLPNSSADDWLQRRAEMRIVQVVSLAPKSRILTVLRDGKKKAVWSNFAGTL